MPLTFAIFPGLVIGIGRFLADASATDARQTAPEKRSAQRRAMRAGARRTMAYGRSLHGSWVPPGICSPRPFRHLTSGSGSHSHRPEGRYDPRRLPPYDTCDEDSATVLPQPQAPKRAVSRDASAKRRATLFTHCQDGTCPGQGWAQGLQHGLRGQAQLLQLAALGQPAERLLLEPPRTLRG